MQVEVVESVQVAAAAMEALEQAGVEVLASEAVVVVVEEACMYEELRVLEACLPLQ